MGRTSSTEAEIRDVVELKLADAIAERDAAELAVARWRSILDAFDFDGAWDAANGHEPPAVELVVKAKAKTSGGWAKSASKVPCPDCGKMFHPAGLGPHRRKHAKATTPAELAAQDADDRLDPDVAAMNDHLRANPPLRPVVSQIKDHHFECGECDCEGPSVDYLRAHVASVHKRPLLPPERRPVKDGE